MKSKNYHIFQHKNLFFLVNILRYMKIQSSAKCLEKVLCITIQFVYNALLYKYCENPYCFFLLFIITSLTISKKEISESVYTLKKSLVRLSGA